MKSAAIIVTLAGLAVATTIKRDTQSFTTFNDKDLVNQLCEPLDENVDKLKCRVAAQECIDELGEGQQTFDKATAKKIQGCLYNERQYVNPDGDSIKNYLAQYRLDNKDEKELYLKCYKDDRDGLTSSKHMVCKVFHSDVAGVECGLYGCRSFATQIQVCDSAKSGCTGCRHKGVEQWKPHTLPGMSIPAFNKTTFQCDRDYASGDKIPERRVY